MLEDLVASGRVADIALVVLAVETALTLLLRRLSGSSQPNGPLVANAAAGLFLLAALRFALVGAPAGAVALALAGGGLAHGAARVLEARGAQGARDVRQSGSVAKSPEADGQ